MFIIKLTLFKDLRRKEREEEEQQLVVFYVKKLYLILLGFKVLSKVLKMNEMIDFLKL